MGPYMCAHYMSGSFYYHQFLEEENQPQVKSVSTWKTGKKVGHWSYLGGQRNSSVSRLKTKIITLNPDVLSLSIHNGAEV